VVSVLTLALVMLVMVAGASAQPRTVGYQMPLSLCPEVRNPETNRVFCWSPTDKAAYYWNGTAWVPITGAGAGVTAINGLVGPLNLLGTANQLTVTTAGPNLTLSLPSIVIAPGTVTGTLTDRGGQVYNIQANYGGAATGCLPTNSAAANVTAFNALIAIVPTGATIYCPVGDYPVNGTVTFTAPVTMTGAGDDCNFVVDAATSSTADIFVARPSVTGAGVAFYEFSHFRISGSLTGVGGRHVLHLDGSLGHIRNLMVTRLKLDHVGQGRAIYASGTGTIFGTPAHSTITDNRLVAGITFELAGDNIRIANNEIYGFEAGVSAVGLDYNPIGGAGSLLVHGNLFAGAGAVLIRGGVSGGGAASGVMLTENQVEGQPGPNGAAFDIDGNVGFAAVGTVISGGTIQIPVLDGIRVNHASKTIIRGVRIKRGSTPGAKDIVITANATDTTVETNTWVDGVPIADMIDDAGTRTVVMAAVAGGVYVTPSIGIGLVPPTTGIAVEQSGPGVPIGAYIKNLSSTGFGYVGAMGSAGNYLNSVAYGPAYGGTLSGVSRNSLAALVTSTRLLVMTGAAQPIDFATLEIVRATIGATGGFMVGALGARIDPGAGKINVTSGYQVADAALNFSHLAGSATCAQLPALTGSVTTSAGSCATTIAALAVTNAMLAGSIDLTTKVTGVLPGVKGGTGLSTAAIGDLIYASATTPTWSRLAAVATGSVLASAGTSTAPAWSTTPSVGTLHVTGSSAGANSASHGTLYQVSSAITQALAWGPDAATNGIFRVATIRSNGSNVLFPFTVQAGVQVGAPTGGDKAGAINVQGVYWANGTAGVSCTAGTVSLLTFTVVNGIVTAC